jgi:hypothetical protein
MNGEVVDIIDAGLTDKTYYGMIMSSELLTYSTGTGQSAIEYFATVVCTDGVTRQCVIPGDYYSKWTLISISYVNGKPEAKRLSSKTLSGTVNSSASILGDYAFADNIEIMEISGNGDWTVLYPNRLANAEFTDEIQYYLLNEKNELAVLILKNATGDMYSYGLITSVNESSAPAETAETRVVSRSYAYMIDGKPGTISINGRITGLERGSGFLIGGDRTIMSIKNLRKVSLTDISVSQQTAVGENKKYTLASNVQVYLCVDKNYYPTELSAVSDTSVYSLYGCYESDFPLGGQLRLIVATRK